MFLLNRTRKIPASFSAFAVISVFALGITATAQGDDPPHVVFVTSASGTGDLGSWPEADGGALAFLPAETNNTNIGGIMTKIPALRL